MRRPALLPLIALGTLHCGQPVHDGAYRGEPLAVIEGILDQPAGSSEAIPDTLAVGLIWAGADPFDLEARVWQPGVSASLARQDDFRLVIHDKPPPAARTAGYAIGRLLLFEDIDGDGAHDPGERLRATYDGMRVVWSAGGLNPDEHPVTLPLPPGLHVIEGHLPCTEPFVRTGDVEDCGIPLGQPCQADRDCGEPANAVCARDEGSREPRGYCLARLTRTGCRPPDARRVPRYYRDGRWRWFFYPACTADADCPAPLVCREGSGACGSGSEQVRLLLGIAEGFVCTDHLIEGRNATQ